MPPHEELHHWHKKAPRILRGGVTSPVLTTLATMSVFTASFLGTLNFNPDPVLASIPDTSVAQHLTNAAHTLNSFTSSTLASLSPVSQLAAAGTTDLIGTLSDWWHSLFPTNTTAVNTPPTPPIVRTPATSTASLPLRSASTPSSTTYITQPVIERTIVQQGNGITQSSLTLQLTTLKDELLSRIASINLLAPSLPAATFQAFAQSQRIDQLTNTSITNATVHGLNGLTDADIPDGITAANYLALGGGILTGALTGTSLTLSGLLTAGSLAVAAISSSGAVEAPYFTATSTTASSTFPNLLSTNSTTTNATSTNLFSTTASSTNLFSTFSTFANSVIATLTATIANITTLTATTLTATNATTTQLDAFNYIAVGKTATTTIRGDGIASTIPYASTTALTSSGSAYFATSGGNVGIGTSSPLTRLSLQGIAGANDLLNIASSTGASALYVNAAGSVGIGTTTPWAQLSINPISANGIAPSFVIGSSTATNFIVTNSGNTGVGTTSPTGRLAVQGAGTGTGTLFNLANSVFTTLLNVLDNGTAYFLGNLGVGTSTPWRKLSVTDTVASPQVAIAYDATRYAQLQVDSGGDLTFSAQGGDVYLTNENFFSCTSGCAAGNPTGTGNILAENKIGIGTTTPLSKLTIETQDTTTDFFQISSSTAQSIFGIFANGRVGVATSSPWKTFSVSGDGVLSGTFYLPNSVASIMPTTCPSGMIPVPGSPADGMQGFCVDKYEAQAGVSVEQSVQGGSPWVSIAQTTARAQCIRAGKHLITEQEWLTIAHNAENVGWNWNGGVAGTNQMSDGHSDNVPASALATADDSSPCSGTGQTCSLTTWDSQRRTYQLSNGEYIWDLGGNVWEWVDQTVTNDYPIVNSAAAGWQACSTSGDGICGNTRTTNDQWYRGGFATIAGFLRGGGWDSGTIDGAFTLLLNAAPSVVLTIIGFRCAR